MCVVFAPFVFVVGVVVALIASFSVGVRVGAGEEMM